MRTKNVHKLRLLVVASTTIMLLLAFALPVLAEPLPLPNVNLQIGAPGSPGGTGVIQLLIVMTLLTLAPALVITMTSFTRIVVVLSFLRSSLATQQMPPNQVLIGLALFLTFFIMAPTLGQVNTRALQPYLRGEINTDVAFSEAMQPLRAFMFKQTREKDLALFVRMANLERPRNFDDIPNYVLIPSFIISELKTAFQIGFILFIPFLIIDMVVASALMSMGMMMLPPMMISLPFKILLFVLVDGWNLVVQSLMLSFK